MPGHWTDARGDDDPFPPEGCDCEHGVRRVGPAYPETMYPGDLPALELALAEIVGRMATPGHATPAELVAAQKAVDTLKANRAIAADAVFPCPRCRHAQYERWRNGCYRLGHPRRTCRVCGPNATTIRSEAS